MNRRTVLGVLGAAASLFGCGGSKAAADCMTAMAQVACPSGTRPEAASDGSDGSDGFSSGANLQTYRAEASDGSNANCDYVCIPRDQAHRG